jgi:hypothetical protein
MTYAQMLGSVMAATTLATGVAYTYEALDKQAEAVLTQFDTIYGPGGYYAQMDELVQSLGMFEPAE